MTFLFCSKFDKINPLKGFLKYYFHKNGTNVRLPFVVLGHIYSVIILGAHIISFSEVCVCARNPCEPKVWGSESFTQFCLILGSV